MRYECERDVNCNPEGGSVFSMGTGEPGHLLQKLVAVLMAVGFVNSRYSLQLHADDKKERTP